MCTVLCYLCFYGYIALLIVLVVGVSTKQNNEVICLFFATGYFYQMLPASIVMQCLFLIVVSLNDSIRDVSILSSTVKEKQGRIHGISRSPSSFLPAEKKKLPTDRRTDRRTEIGRAHV